MKILHVTITAAAAILLFAGSLPVAKADSGKDLIEASTKGDMDRVKLLLGRGADIDAMDGGGRTPLVMSISKGHYTVAKYLVGRGANVNTKGYDGFCPLYAAVSKNNTDIALLLLSKGADPNAVLTDDCPVLFLAIKNDNAAIVRELVSRGADVNFASMAVSHYDPEAEPETPLQVAKKKGNRKIIDMLVKAGAK